MKKFISIVLTAMMLTLCANVGVFAEEPGFEIDQEVMFVTAGKNRPVRVALADAEHYIEEYLGYDYLVFPDGCEPFIDECGRVEVPVKFIAEEVGFSVDWDADTQSVTMTKDDKSYTFYPGNSAFVANGRTITMDTMKAAPMIVNDHMFIPLWYMAYAIGYEIDFMDREFIEDIDTITTDAGNM